MVSALDRKLLRDLWHMRGQVLAIALVLAAATATFVLSMGVHASLTATRDTYYARNQFAEVFANMTRAPRAVIDRVGQVPGVRRAEGSIQQFATLDMADSHLPVRALLSSVDEEGHDRLNQLTLRQGRMPRPGAANEVVADEAFVKANGLGLGSSLAAIVHGRRLELKIVGIGLAPNFIYALAPGELLPDNSRFGIFWMGRRALEAATDRREAVNALALTLEPGASEAEVIRKVDALLEPYGGTGAYGRKDQLSHAFLDNELNQLQAMTKVIPPVFLLVSTFLVYIVLGRMISTERTQIGLMKAFGYSSAALAGHYLKFALVIAFVATLGGSIAGIWMGRSMTELYAQYYRFPFLEYHLSPTVFAGAAALSFSAAALGAMAGMRNAVRLSPAVAMAAPPPPVYRSGWTERLGRAAGFSATGNMVVRHIARWPWRSTLTVVGVALSLALLFATLQFLDASRTMLDSYFLRGQRQDLTVTFIEPRNEQALHELARLPGVLRVEPSRAVPARLRYGNRMERTAIERVDEAAALSLRFDSEARILAPPPAGLMLSRQMADKLGVRVGDNVQVEVLGGRRTVQVLPVASVVDEFIGKRAYAVGPTLDRIARDSTPASAALLRVDALEKDRVLARLKQVPGVLGVSERDAALAKFEEMIDENIFTMLFFYISFASAIAVGVVYNSARILFSERAHELATLRVLGYHRSEVGTVLLGEIALLVLLAVPLGCVMGYWLAQLMTAMFSSDLFRLPFAPSRASYGYATVVVLLAAMLTALVVARRVMRLDMVRVLKARD